MPCLGHRLKRAEPFHTLISSSFLWLVNMKMIGPFEDKELLLAADYKAIEVRSMSAFTMCFSLTLFLLSRLSLSNHSFAH